MLSIELDTTDEMGVACKKHLICELMGKHSNVVLCGEDNRIIDAMRRVDGDLSRKATRCCPACFTVCRPHRTSTIRLPFPVLDLRPLPHQADGEQTLDRFLLNTLLGFSPLLCRELAFRATGDTAKPLGTLSDEERNRLAKVYDDFLAYIEEKRWKPFLLTKNEDSAVFDFTFLPVTQYEGLMNVTQYESFSSLLAAFLRKREG